MAISKTMMVSVIFVLLLAVLLSFTNKQLLKKDISHSASSVEYFVHSHSSVDEFSFSHSSVFLSISDGSTLEFDFYRDTCPNAETIVRSTMLQIYNQHKEVPANLLRLFFHDCFIQGCDASILLDDSNGNESHPIERQAIPNQSLKGFDKIDLIKEELEKACPGVVSCADTLALATRDGVVLAGGPFYPVFTGRRDSLQSYHDKATAEIPKPDDELTQTLHLFGIRGFSERDIVTLLGGGHSIGKIGCQFVQKRLYNFNSTGQPDPSIASDFLNEMRLICPKNNITSSNHTSSVSSGAGFDAHYYQRLLRGRGFLFSDQQLMADANTATLVRAYATADDGASFRRDFARAMVRLSFLGPLTGSKGVVRLNCSVPLHI